MAKFSLWTIFVLTLFVQSCGCNWHLKKVHQKCGITTKTDTVYVKVRDSIPPIYVTGTISLQKQDSLLTTKTDSIFDKTKTSDAKCDSVIASLKAQINHLIKNRPILPEAKTIYTHGGYIKAWIGKNGFEFQVDIPKQVIERSVPVAVTNNEFKPEPGWQKWLGWILFLLTLILALLFRRK